MSCLFVFVEGILNKIWQTGRQIEAQHLVDYAGVSIQKYFAYQVEKLASVYVGFIRVDFVHHRLSKITNKITYGGSYTACNNTKLPYFPGKKN